MTKSHALVIMSGVFTSTSLIILEIKAGFLKLNDQITLNRKNQATTGAFLQFTLKMQSNQVKVMTIITDVITI